MYFKDFLCHRKVWLGFAIVWIILYHLPFALPIGVFDWVKNIGYGGVDICLFASGIGCYYSLSSNSDVGVFIKKRFNRVMPTYWIFIVFWLVYKFVIGEFGWKMAIGNFFAVQYITGNGNEFNWYITAIIIFYFLAPYFKIIADKKSLVLQISFLTFLVGITIAFWNSTNIIITTVRLIIFYIGMIFGSVCKSDTKVSRWHICFGVLMLVAGLLILRIFLKSDNRWSYGLYWYPFILITPPLCMVISLIASLFDKTRVTKPIFKFLSLCGEYSFELYLIHILLISIISMVITKFNLVSFTWVAWLVGLIALVILCFLLKKATALSESLFLRVRSVIVKVKV